MAKKKGNRILIAMECTETGARSYITQKNKVNSGDKLQIMKYNKKLRKHTLHKEVQRLK
jgi:large subunit ribosomal protein L33